MLLFSISTILITIASIIVGVLFARGKLFDKRFKGIKKVRANLLAIIILNIGVVLIMCYQEWERRKEEKTSEETIHKKVEDKTKEIIDSIASSFKKQDLVFNKTTFQVQAYDSNMQLKTGIISSNLDKAKRTVDKIQLNSESILNPILPMDVVIEYEIKVPSSVFSKRYPYIEKPSMNKHTSISEFSLDSLSREEQSYINLFDYVNLHRYSIESKSIKDNDWIAIEQHNLKNISIQGNAKIIDNNIIITVYKTMKNVFIRNKDYAGIQNYTSLAGWYLNINAPNDLQKILQLKIYTGVEKAQKILLTNIIRTTKKQYSFFEKKISAKHHFIFEYQGP